MLEKVKQKLAARNRRELTLIAVVLGSSVAILDGTIVNLALPSIGSEWHTGYASLQWITDAYALSLSALVLLGGSLGDIFGRKKIYLLGVSGFGVASLLCALSPNVETLIGLRIVQGVFGALLVPGALSIINTTFDTTTRPQAIGRWTSWSSIAIISGPFLGGWILSVTSWRWIFFINIPLITICYALAAFAANETHDERRRSVDVVGALFAVGSLASFAYGLIEGPVYHWEWPQSGALALGVMLLVAFLWCEKKLRDPMLKLSLFASRNFTGANIMTFLMYGALGGFSFSLVIYLQTHLHYTPFQAGISMLPISLCMMLFSGRVGKMSAIYGPRLFMTLGPIMAGIGMFLLFFLRSGDSYLIGVLPGVLIFSFGLTLLVSPLTTTVMMAVSESDSGIASGVNNAVARSAGLIVVAMLGLLGSMHAYVFAMALCTGLSLLAGIVSYVMIRNYHRVPSA